MGDLFNPTKEHQLLRATIAEFVGKEIEPGAEKRDKNEFFDRELFRKLGEMGLLGVTAPSKYGGSEMDAVAAVIAAALPGWKLGLP